MVPLPSTANPLADCLSQKKKSYAAIKTVHATKLSGKVKQNLESEIRILKELQHPHIVALFACIETPGNIHIVMEYCQMSDLAQFMKSRMHMAQDAETADIFHKYPNSPNGGLNEVLARNFIKQTASGLQYLRKKHIVHRDLKPQNLLLNPPPTFMQKQRPEDVPLAASEHSLIPAVGIASLPMIKIADFGFARHLPAASLAETLCGSPLYMAPEILNYQKYDAKADLWSVGTIAYEMVVGRPPFRANNHIELLKKIKAAEDVIQFPAGVTISRDYKNLIRSLLKQDPIERISFERFFQDKVILGDIPGLMGDDIPQVTDSSMDPSISRLTDRLRKQDINSAAQDREDVPAGEPVRRASGLVSTQSPGSTPTTVDSFRTAPEDHVPRRPQSGKAPVYDEPERPSSQNETRRPTMVPHSTASPRQLPRQTTRAPDPALVSRYDRHVPSSTSAPPKSVMTEQLKQRERERALREAAQSPRTNAAEDEVAFEREWVKVDKQSTEVNALADELQNRIQKASNHQTSMVRRATTQGAPTSITGAQPSAPSNAMQIAAGRRADHVHARHASYERRYAPTFAAQTLRNVLQAANQRLWGDSPPFGLGLGKGPSPPQGYGAFPQYPAPLPHLLTDGRDASFNDLDEHSRMCWAVEQAATRSDVVYGFAEVKYKQIIPATPSANDGLGIHQINVSGHPGDFTGEVQEEELTQVAIVAVAEEAFVLYVKALSILTKTINMVRYWWEHHRPAELQPGTSLPANIRSADVSRKMNNVLQWARNRFNECVEKSEVVARRLIEAQKRLPTSHPGHPSNHRDIQGSGSGNNFGLLAEQLHLTTGVTAEGLMHDRATEMSRAAALQELVDRPQEVDLNACELSYVTAICMWEAVLENDDDDMSFTLPSQLSRSGNEVVSGLQRCNRNTVVQSKSSSIQAFKVSTGRS